MDPDMDPDMDPYGSFRFLQVYLCSFRFLQVPSGSFRFFQVPLCSVFAINKKFSSHFSTKSLESVTKMNEFVRLAYPKDLRNTSSSREIFQPV